MTAWFMRNESACLRMLAFAGLLFIVTALPAPALAQAVEEAPTPGPYPPSGDRLRDLAERLNFDIGYAARFNWAELEQAELYENITASEFNIVTPENSVKWVNVHPSQDTYDFTDMDILRDFADQHGMQMHGHPLTWYRQNPLWLDTLNAADVQQALQSHIAAVVGRYQGRIAVWDVVNEGLDDAGTALRDNVFLDALGPAYIDIAFQAARNADPDAILLYNDFGVGWLNGKSDRMFNLIADLQQRDIPIDGAGLQMHIDHTFAHAEGFSSNMQRLADRDLDIYITEFDVGVLQIEDYPQQAEVYQDIIERCLMQPRCKALQIWGIDDFHSWRPFFDPLPFDDDFQIKPAYYGMQRALSVEPIHPELCDTSVAIVQSGAVMLTVSGTDQLQTDPAELAVVCSGVRFENGFQSMRLRYRNSGVNTPVLSLTAAGDTLVEVALNPVQSSDEGDFQTIELMIDSSITGTRDLRLVVTGDGREDVGIDAMLLTSPAGSLDLRPAGSGGGSRSGGGSSSLLLILGLILLAGVRRMARNS